MSKDIVHAIKGKPAPDKRKASLVQQESKKRHIIFIAGIIIICAAVFLTGWGVYVTSFKPWGEDALKINNTELNMKQYMARARYILQEQGVTNPREYSSLSTILPQVTETIINDELMIQGAQEKNITVTDEQVMEQIKKVVLPESDTESDAKTTSTTEFDSLYKELLKQYNIEDEEYRELTRNKLTETALVQDYLNPEVGDTAAQVHLYLISVATEDEAKAARERLNNGEDFTAVAQEISTDSAKESGGEIGWYAHDALSTDFADIIFALNAGDVSEPVSNSDGSAYYLFKVTEKEESRKLDETNLSALQTKHLQDWITERTYSSVIDNKLTDEKYAWIMENI